MAWMSRGVFPERAASNMRCAKSRVSGGSDSDGGAVSRGCSAVIVRGKGTSYVCNN